MSRDILNTGNISKNSRSMNIIESINNSRRAVISVIIMLFAVSLASCASEVNHHGHVFTETEIKQIRPGMSKQQVTVALGTPTTTSAVGGGAYYYISSTHKHVAFLKPKVTDRRVVVIYFSNNDEVKRVARYGLKDGKIFDFVSKTTPSHAGSDSILESIFKGVGPKVSL